MSNKFFIVKGQLFFEHVLYSESTQYFCASEHIMNFTDGGED